MDFHFAMKLQKSQEDAQFSSLAKKYSSGKCFLVHCLGSVLFASSSDCSERFGPQETLDGDDFGHSRNGVKKFSPSMDAFEPQQFLG